MATHKILQANLRHSIAASAIALSCFDHQHLDLLLIQEPWINKGVKGLTHKLGKLVFDTTSTHPRAALVIRKTLNHTPLTQYLTRDLAAILITIETVAGKQDIVVASAYFPGDSTSDPPPAEVRKLITFCQSKDLAYVIGCDANAHHTSWASTNTNSRGELLFDYLTDIDAIVLNEGNEPTFSSNGRDEVLDISFCSQSIFTLFENWQVSNEPSLSDHKHIRFDLNVSIDSLLKTSNPKLTNWNLFTDIIAAYSTGRSVKYSNPSDIEFGACQITKFILQSHALSTKTIQTKKSQPPWWTADLNNLRKQTRKLFNSAKRSGNFSEYKACLNIYNSSIRIAKKRSWERFAENLDPKTSYKILKSLNKPHNNGIGFLRTPSGYTTDRKETLDLLLATHFPDSTLPTTTHLQTSGLRQANDMSQNYNISQAIFSERKVKWAIESFSPFKSPGGDNIIPIMLQKSLPHLTTPFTSLFQASFASGYIPSTWRKVNVIFIPKPGKDSAESKSYRPISLTSFFLKTMERLVDLYIRETIKLSQPIHPLQFAYTKGKSTELAAHHLVSKLEEAQSKNLLAISTFMDISGAFDNTGFSSMYKALEEKNVEPTCIGWIKSVLEHRIITSSLGGVTTSIIPSKGCPQGGVLSPLLWSLVIDELLADLNSNGFHAIGYADDVAVTITGKFASTISELTYSALRRTHTWCCQHGLTINPAKTTLIPFYKTKANPFPPITFQNQTISFSEETTYLGLTLDRKLSWKSHLIHTLKKATKCLFAFRSMTGRTWGISPDKMLLLYKTMIRPITSYGSMIWWPILEKQYSIKLCNKLQRTACLLTTGCTRSTPTIPMEAILGLRPLHLHILESGANSAMRLECTGKNIHKRSPVHGLIISCLPDWEQMSCRNDISIPNISFDVRFETIIPKREAFLSQNNPLLESTHNWFTDGSKTDEGTGCGVCGPTDRFSMALDGTATVFQTEVLALSLCAREILKGDPHDQTYSIFCDSQAAIKAVGNFQSTSKLVLDCKSDLNQLATNNRVKIIWIPGHSGLEGNEVADELARQGSAATPWGPLPSLAFGRPHITSRIGEWIDSLQTTYRNNQIGLRQSRRLINTKNLADIPLNNRKNLKTLIGFLTGHHPTLSYLHRIGKSHTATCRLCNELDETTEHILMKCWMLSPLRTRIFGQPTLESEDIAGSPGSIISLFLRRAEKSLG